MPTLVTDPDLLRQLNAPAARQPVTDPALLAQLNGEPAPVQGPPAPPPVEVNPVVDVAKAVPSKFAEGAVKLLGLPGDLARGVVWGADKATSLYTGEPYEDVRNRRDATAMLPSTRLDRITGEGMKNAVEHDQGFQFYQPQTRAGKIAGAAAEFVPGAAALGGGGVRALAGNALKYGVIPGAASEAVGQAADTVGMGDYARPATALLAGGAAGYLSGPAKTLTSVADKLKGLPPGEVDAILARAQQLRDDGAAQASPVFISNASAIDTASGGRTNISEMERHIEGLNGPLPEYAGNPQAIDDSARAHFDAMSPPAPPSEVGPQFNEAARAAMAQTPEAQGLAAAQAAAGPRVTPEQAGQVIQPALRGEYDARAAVRAAQANQDYEAARNSASSAPVGERMTEQAVPPYGGAPEPNLTPQQMDAMRSAVVSGQIRAGVNPAGIDPQRVDQAVQALARGVETDPAAAYANGPQHASGRTQQVPEPILGQVDIRPVAEAVADEQAVQRGGARDAMNAADRALRGPGGQLGHSVEEVTNSRRAIGDLIEEATRDGQNNTVRVLTIAQRALDEALGQVPEVATANANFARNSVPLNPFDRTPPIMGAIERDVHDTHFIQPPEQVPGALQAGGPSTSRAFNEVAPAGAREAYEQHLTTTLLDSATDAAPGIGHNGGPPLPSSDRIRSILRDNEDLLAQHPVVATRLADIATAREGLERIQGTALGRLANADPTVAAARNELFPTSPEPHSTADAVSALSAVVRNNPWAARQLVRAHAEGVFEQVAQDVVSGPSHSVGPKFENAIRGNPNSERAKNLDGLIRALPDGNTIADGFHRFLDVLDAGGRRMNVGSKTAYNPGFLKTLREGGIGKALTYATVGVLKLPGKMLDTIEDWKMGRNVQQMARLLSDPDAIAAFRGIMRAGDVSGPTGRLIAIASRSAGQDNNRQ